MATAIAGPQRTAHRRAIDARVEGSVRASRSRKGRSMHEVHTFSRRPSPPGRLVAFTFPRPRHRSHRPWRLTRPPVVPPITSDTRPWCVHLSLSRAPTKAPFTLTSIPALAGIALTPAPLASAHTFARPTLESFFDQSVWPMGSAATDARPRARLTIPQYCALVARAPWRGGAKTGLEVTHDGNA